MNISLIINFEALMVVSAIIGVSSYIYRFSDSHYKLIHIANLTLVAVLMISFGALIYIFSDLSDKEALGRNLYFIIIACFYASVFNTFSRIYKSREM